MIDTSVKLVTWRPVHTWTEVKAKQRKYSSDTSANPMKNSQGLQGDTASSYRSSPLRVTVPIGTHLVQNWLGTGKSIKADYSALAIYSQLLLITGTGLWPDSDWLLHLLIQSSDHFQHAQMWIPKFQRRFSRVQPLHFQFSATPAYS